MQIILVKVDQSWTGIIRTYIIIIINAIPSLLDQYVPVPLVPKESLETILQQVATEQLKSRDRLTLAISLDELLTVLLRTEVASRCSYIEPWPANDGVNTVGIPANGFHSLQSNSGPYATAGKRICTSVDCGNGVFRNF